MKTLCYRNYIRIILVLVVAAATVFLLSGCKTIKNAESEPTVSPQPESSQTVQTDPIDPKPTPEEIPHTHEAIIHTAENIEKLQKQLKDSTMLILMYHHFTEDESQTSSVTVTAKRLEEDLIWLRDNGYQTILPREIAAISEGLQPWAYAPESAPRSIMNLGEKLVVITLDDGYASNYELLFPLLKKYNAKAEINVITSLIDNEANTFFASWDQLKEMSDSGLVEIGSHTHNLHNPDNGGNLNQKGPNGVERLKHETDEAYKARVTDDIIKSANLIEEHIGAPVITFAYPYGANDKYSRETVGKHFKFSVLTNPGTFSLQQGLYGLNRMGVRPDTDIEELFKKNLK